MKVFKTLLDMWLATDSKEEKTPEVELNSLKAGFLHELRANKHNLKYFVVFVMVGDQKEMITFTKLDSKQKADYYEKAYDSSMRLKANPDVRIMHWGWTAGTTKLGTGFYKLDAMAVKKQEEGVV